MAKKKTGEEEGEEGKKKSKKKIVIVLVLVGLFAGKTFFAPKPSAEDKAAAEKKAEEELLAMCEHWNSPEAEGGEHAADENTEDADASKAEGEDGEKKTSPKTTTTIAMKQVELGAVLELESKTVNLVDGHYLKFGLGLQLPVGVESKLAEEEGKGAKPLDLATKLFRTKSQKDLLDPATFETLQQELGYDVCSSTEGEIITVYFTEFVMQ